MGKSKTVATARPGGIALLPSTLHRVTHVEQDLEVELLSAVGEVERGHLGLIAGRLGTLERLAVHLVEVRQDTIAGTGHGAGRGLGRLVPEAGDPVEDLLRVTPVEEESLRRPENESSRVDWVRQASLM